MAKPFGGKRPQDLRHTLRRFMDYLGRHKIMLGVVGLLAAVSALAALLGTYMIRPIVNGVLENGSAAYLAGVVALTAGIYIVGALSTLGYTQIMVRAAQKILQDIRRDLFGHDLGRAEQQLCGGHPDLYSGRRHAAFAVRPQLAALAAGGRWLYCHVLVYQLLDTAQPRLLCAPAGQPR